MILVSLKLSTGRVTQTCLVRAARASTRARPRPRHKRRRCISLNTACTKIYCAARQQFAWEPRLTFNSLNLGLGHVFCSSHHLICSLCLDDFNYSAIKLSYAAYALSEIPIWYLLWMLISVEMGVSLPWCLYGNNSWPSFIQIKLQFSMLDIRSSGVPLTVIWSSPSNLTLIWIIYWDVYFSVWLQFILHILSGLLAFKNFVSFWLLTRRFF